MMSTKRKDRLAAALAVAGLGLAGCSAGTSTASVTQAKLSSDILKFAVGTANVFGDVPGSAVTGLNVAASFRQPAGALAPGSSAVLVSQPTITGPIKLPVSPGTSGLGEGTVLTGPAPGELGGSTITGSAQNTTTVTSFGTAGGVFGLGIEPFNYGDGSPATNVPYPVPLYDAVAGDPNAFVPWGGPPAFNLAGNGQSVVGSATEPSGQAGLSEGLDVFAGVTPGTGTYTLTANVPANTAQPTFSATASLGSTALLPAITPPTPTLDGTGGGSFAAVLPAGVTEAYLQITDFGPVTGTACNGASTATPIYYTVEVTSAAPSGTLPDAAGPGGAPSLCTVAANTTATMGTATGDQFTVQSVGFDYPLYESSYTTGSSNINPSPTLTGANGQADITVSSSAGYVVGATGAATLVARHLTAPMLKSRSGFGLH